MGYVGCRLVVRFARTFCNVLHVHPTHKCTHIWHNTSAIMNFTRCILKQTKKRMMRVNLGPNMCARPQRGLCYDDTTNSTCPKPRRAKPSRQTSSNQRVQDTVKFRPDAEMHNNWHLQLANAILMVLLQSLFFAKTQTAAGSGSKRLSRPHGKDSLDTKDCNETPPTSVIHLICQLIHSARQTKNQSNAQ